MKRENNGGGVGFTGLLTIVFITLKLLGKISWPWIWVISPIWISICVGVILAVAIALSNILRERL